MNVLDNQKQIKKIDKSKLLSSIELLGEQCKQAWQETRKIKIPQSYRKVKNVVINGMGGSAIGGHIIKALWQKELKAPLEIVNDYSLPDYLNKDSLVILSSYSGTTEEVLAAAKEAVQKKAKILGITTNGELSRFFVSRKLPAYLFEPRFNPCGQPRMGLGYSVLGQVGLFRQVGLIDLKSDEVETMVGYLRNLNQRFGLSSVLRKNPAKKIAQALDKKIPVLIGSEFLVGNIHTLTNQLNESAKNFAVYFSIPELNHHLMEGLRFPDLNQTVLKFFFINSNFYHPRTQKRYQITQAVVKRNNIDFVEYQPQAKIKFLQSFEILSLGSYISFYLAMLNKLDPSPVPWVDYFKKRLV